jgi:hypothetical protein
LPQELRLNARRVSTAVARVFFIGSLISSVEQCRLTSLPAG